MDADPITVRVREFMQLLGNTYKYFEDTTGIASTRWRDLNHAKTKAIPADMLASLCETWPEFALWFATGTKESPRGQTTPYDYYDLTYGKVSAIEWGDIEVFRDKLGILRPDLGDQGHEDKASVAYEISVAFRLLKFSAFASNDDADSLSSAFWKDFLKPLKKNGPSIRLSRKDLKRWINQWPIKEPERSKEADEPIRSFFLASPQMPPRRPQ